MNYCITLTKSILERKVVHNKKHLFSSPGYFLLTLSSIKEVSVFQTFNNNEKAWENMFASHIASLCIGNVQILDTEPRLKKLIKILNTFSTNFVSSVEEKRLTRSPVITGMKELPVPLRDIIEE